jgi:phosphinothricin acetyltransferase
LIREAEPSRDAAACAAIYAPYVEGSIISFEERAPSAAEVQRRMEASHAWLVAEEDGVVVGYAYGSQHRDRAAYRWAADVAAYVQAEHHGRGLGKALYARLFEQLRGRGIWTVCGGVAVPNEASDALHRSLGFEEVGVYRRIGWKEGAWRDVRWWQLQLRPGDEGASPPG